MQIIDLKFTKWEKAYNIQRKQKKMIDKKVYIQQCQQTRIMTLEYFLYLKCETYKTKKMTKWLVKMDGFWLSDRLAQKEI